MNFRVFETGKCYHEFRNMNGSRLYHQDNRLFLVISYDDILDDEVAAFQHAPFEVVFKTFGLISLFTFKFDSYIVDAPFNQFAEYHSLGCESDRKNTVIPLIIYICESATGELLVKRETTFPSEFCAALSRLLKERYLEYADQYDFWKFNKGINEIYDNHIIEEIYKLAGDREISCMVH